MSALKIILPIRNPTEVLRQTITSLVAQTDRDFRVLVSDNFSSKGVELVDEAVAQLQSAGLTVRRVRPPVELGRVEHWNWAHHEATGAWLKPLFAGDWLEPGYVASWRTAALNPACRYVFSNYTLHRSGHPPQPGESAETDRHWTAAEMRDTVLRHGMQFGPPSTATYQRDAFLAVGGYPTALPICADSLLFCTLAASFGATWLKERLCHFNIHGARFSTTLPGKRRQTLSETFTYSWLLAYQARAEGVAFSRVAFARMLARAWRDYARGR